jgi:serine phosphatase RsbU (regulator of sigma subunit)/pSer/pThr/pTyr-binding forkhead associated (FHA) protein
MAQLLVRKGVRAGQRLPLEGDTIVLGRSPDCDIALPSPSISRQHARLFRRQEKWFVEDMRSRNGTLVNSQVIAGPTLLRANDQIRICDFEAIFQSAASASTAVAEAVPAAEEIESEEQESSSTLTTIAMHGPKVLEIQTGENLLAILNVSNQWGSLLELDRLLPRIAEGVFQLFAQAERCFLILQDEATGKLTKDVTHTRGAAAGRRAHFSKQVVRQCLDTGQAFLNENTLEIRNFDSTADLALRSVMCTPFFKADGRPFGAIQLDTRDQSRRFTTHDLKLLVGLANQASLALGNALVYQEMQKREQVERDLELAGQVQRSILPEQAPQLPGYQFFTHYHAALEVGGDYYDFIPLPQDRLAITLGDVAGKSVPAAILMAKLSSDVRSCLLTEKEPAAAISRLNQMLYPHLAQTDRWVTLTAALLDAGRHAVTLVNAGHCLPLLYRRASNSWSDAMPTDLSGVPLGVVETPVYTACQVELNPGDTLLFFTDGVPDAMNFEQQQFKLQGIHEALVGGGPYTAESAGQRLVRALGDFSAGYSQYDDITIVCFGRPAS